MKGDIKPDHMRLNKFTFAVAGLIDLPVITVSGLDEEMTVTQLPDFTFASGGEKNPVEFEITLPMHHATADAAMELWYAEAQASDPAYKKPVTYSFVSGSGNARKNYTLSGVFPRKRVTPEADKANEGEMAMVTWGMCTDEVIPL